MAGTTRASSANPGTRKLYSDQLVREGVITEPLPMDRLTAGLPQALADCRPAGWAEAAEAIMTTDTLPKVVSRRVVIAGASVTVNGIAKGAGMIRPNMATMLGFVATDAGVAPALLARWVRDPADASFNRITLDGDTSTNDSFVVRIVTSVCC